MLETLKKYLESTRNEDVKEFLNILIDILEGGEAKIVHKAAGLVIAHKYTFYGTEFTDCCVLEACQSAIDYAKERRKQNEA